MQDLNKKRKIKISIQPGRFFMELEILGNIHKICISKNIIAFHRGTKDILENFLNKVN